MFGIIVLLRIRACSLNAKQLSVEVDEMGKYVSEVLLSHTNPYIISSIRISEFQATHMDEMCLLVVTSYKTKL